MSSKLLFHDIDHKERQTRLKAMAYRVEEKKFARQLEIDEIRHEESKHAESCREIAVLKNELKNIKDEYTAKIKRLESRAAEHLAVSTSGTRQVTEPVYLIRINETDMMRAYDKFGIMVDERGLMPEERQARLFREIDGNIEAVDDGKQQDPAAFENPGEGRKEHPDGEADNEETPGDEQPAEAPADGPDENPADESQPAEGPNESPADDSPEGEGEGVDEGEGQPDGSKLEIEEEDAPLEETAEQFGDETPDWKQAEERRDEKARAEAKSKRTKS
jgi:hypothetical protein